MGTFACHRCGELVDGTLVVSYVAEGERVDYPEKGYCPKCSLNIEHNPATGKTRAVPGAERLCRICQKPLTLYFEGSTEASQVYRCDIHPGERGRHRPADNQWEWESAVPAKPPKGGA
jgi:hypothetical protein